MNSDKKRVRKFDRLTNMMLPSVISPQAVTMRPLLRFSVKFLNFFALGAWLNECRRRRGRGNGNGGDNESESEDLDEEHYWENVDSGSG